MKYQRDRRYFLKMFGGGLIGGALAGCHLPQSDSQTSSPAVPAYLENNEICDALQPKHWGFTLLP